LWVFGQQQAIRLYLALGKYVRASPLQELPLVALHGGTRYIFQALYTASILAAANAQGQIYALMFGAS